MAEYGVKLKIDGKGEHICKKCFHYAVCTYQMENNPIIECSHFVSQSKVFTNADRIRAMSDEELAVFLSQVEEHLFTGNLWSIKTWNEWLKNEVDG